MVGTSGRDCSPVSLLAEKIHVPDLGARLSLFPSQLFQEQNTNGMNLST